MESRNRSLESLSMENEALGRYSSAGRGQECRPASMMKKSNDDGKPESNKEHADTMQNDSPQEQVREPVADDPKLSRLVDEYSLERTGDRPLIFTGARIGFGTSKSHTSTDWSDVTLYKTVGGSYVADVDRFSLSGGSQMCDVFTFPTAESLVAALQDADGKLDRASLAACQDAARNDEDFMNGWVEKVP